MALYSTIQDFKVNHPLETDAIQAIFVSDSGEIHQYIMCVDHWHIEIKALMTSYVFVNGWKSIIHTIVIV